MKIGVIDVGSNSVRLAVFEGERLCKKLLITCRLGEAMQDGNLNDNAIKRTAEAVFSLKSKAAELGAEVVYAFATEAVRKAENKHVFIKEVKALSGIEVSVVDGKTEALLALNGALNGRDGTVIDLGGASTEVAVMQEGKVSYCVSASVGAVVLKDHCGRDKNKLAAFIAQETKIYGKIPAVLPVVAVGGTATSLASCFLKLKTYDPEKTDGTVLSRRALDGLINEFQSKEPELIASEYAVDRRRSEIILGGAMLLMSVLNVAGMRELTVSESDNLEGFYKMLCSGEISAEPCMTEVGK